MIAELTTMTTEELDAVDWLDTLMIDRYPGQVSIGRLRWPTNAQGEASPTPVWTLAWPGGNWFTGNPQETLLQLVVHCWRTEREASGRAD